MLEDEQKKNFKGRKVYEGVPHLDMQVTGSCCVRTQGL